MDQTEPENQIVHRNQQECCDDTNLDSAVCLSASGFPEISIEAEEKYAADAAIIAA